MLRLLAFCLVAVLFGSTEGYFRRVCENQAMSINCGPRVINILSASYGRTRQGVCGNGRTTYCHSGTSMRVAMRECNGLHRCVLYARNSEFGDPCRGTVKYLEVSYNCVVSSSPEYLLRICEGRSHAIHCYGGKRIFIISAIYGRLTGGHICGGPVRTTYCGAPHSLTKVRGYCHGRPSCVLQSKNSVFGDPCRGTKKYIEVRYRCY
ncbi:hypothetical protein ACROYT_G043015 [Oculina patagonica]